MLKRKKIRSLSRAFLIDEDGGYAGFSAVYPVFLPFIL